MKKHLADSVRILFYCLTVLGAAVNADETTQDLTIDDGFRITFHEPLDTMRFQTADGGPLLRGSEVARSVEEGRPLIMTFDAFGRRFELELESNDGLIADLPQAQRDKLGNDLRLYRGRIAGVANSWIRLTQQGDEFSGMIWDGAEIFVIESSEHVARSLGDGRQRDTPYQLIYRLADTLVDEQRCALDPSAKPINDYQALVRELQGLVPEMQAADRQLDLGIVADSQFVGNSSGNPDAAVVARMNVVDGVYSEQVGVRLNVVEIRSLQSNGSLSSSNPGTLLEQFGNFASSSSFDNPGLAHLFTGRNLSGNTIGIAYLSSLCSARFGVGVSEVTGGGTVRALTVAHEIGHNFGAPHDNQSGSACGSTPNGFIMNPFSNGSDQFSQCSLSQMQPNIDNASCVRAITNTPRADVRVTLPNSPITASVGTAFDLRIVVRNSGQAAATNVGARVALPSALSFVSASGGGGSCSLDGGASVGCTVGNVGVNGSRTVTLKLRAQSAGSFNGTVTVSADNEGNSGNNSAQAVFNISGAGTVLFNARFDNNSQGFSYVDDAFRGTKQPRYASGRHVADLGFTGGGLRVVVGGRDNADVLRMSGAWRRTLSLGARQRVLLSFRYRLSQDKNYESDEISEALLSIDGRLVSDTGSSFLARIVGDGEGPPWQSTGWVQTQVDLGVLSAGNHTIRIGAFNNKKTFKDEVTVLLIDDVVARATQ